MGLRACQESSTYVNMELLVLFLVASLCTGVPVPEEKPVEDEPTQAKSTSVNQDGFLKVETPLLFHGGSYVGQPITHTANAGLLRSGYYTVDADGETKIASSVVEPEFGAVGVANLGAVGVSHLGVAGHVGVANLHSAQLAGVAVGAPAVAVHAAPAAVAVGGAAIRTHAVAAAPVAVAAAPVAVAAAPVAVAAAVPSAVTYESHKTVALPPKAVDVHVQHKTVHVPVEKRVHYGVKNFVTGSQTTVHKPTIHAPAIKAPEVFVSKSHVAAPEVTVQQSEVTVESKSPNYVNAPFDAGVVVEKAAPKFEQTHVPTPVEVPHPVPVAQPYAVPVPHPVKTENVVTPVEYAAHHHVVSQPVHAVSTGAAVVKGAVHGAALAVQPAHAVHGVAVHGAAHGVAVHGGAAHGVAVHRGATGVAVHGVGVHGVAQGVAVHGGAVHH